MAHPEIRRDSAIVLRLSTLPLVRCHPRFASCLPVLKAAADPDVFELLQSRYSSFAAKGRGLLIDLFTSAAVDERQRARFVRFLFAQPREKHLPAESLVKLVEQTLRAEALQDTTSDRLEVLYRSVPEAWVSFHARAPRHDGSRPTRGWSRKS